MGADDALPALKKTHTLGSPFLLDAYVTLALFVLSALLVLSSSLVLYLYGLGRYEMIHGKPRVVKNSVFLGLTLFSKLKETVGWWF